jgi:hypothetical protein
MFISLSGVLTVSAGVRFSTAMRTDRRFYSRLASSHVVFLYGMTPRPPNTMLLPLFVLTTKRLNQ